MGLSVQSSEGGFNGLCFCQRFQDIRKWRRVRFASVLIAAARQFLILTGGIIEIPKPGESKISCNCH